MLLNMPTDYFFLFRPLIGTVNAIKYGLLLHSVATAFLGAFYSFYHSRVVKHCFMLLFILLPSASVSSGRGVAIGMPLLAAGASALPIMIGFLTEQVSN